VARERAERGGQHAVGPRQRRELPRLRHAHHPARHAQLVLHRHAPLEVGHVLLGREQEQVAHALQVDLPAGPLAEARPGVERAHRDPHVQLVGEHRAHAARTLRGGARAELAALQQQHVVHTRLCQVERDAQADHATAHDHH
jgi:hypothetical protein